MSVIQENKKNFEISDIKKIKVVLASPEKIVKDWSYGVIDKAETVNYRTFKPEKGGLFCEQVFGPSKDYECACGKYKSRTYEGVICDKCRVTVTSSRVRRERLGHIDLAVPVAHIWFYRVNPCRIALILGLTSTELKSILFYEKWIVVESGDTDLKEKEVFTDDQYYKVQEKYVDNTYKVAMGAQAIRDILVKMDLEQEITVLKEKIEDRRRKNKEPYPKDLKRLELLNDFHISGNRPEWMILSKLPVIPPELRPMIQLDGGRFATSDLNDLYRRVINRNNRLIKLKQRNAPEIILRNEKRMLQEAVDGLLDNSRSKKTLKVNNNRPLKSLSDLFKGKQGRFRQNLLGKRVDYSGRSVIVVGPKLKLYQCGVPKNMALELFRPFLVRELKKLGYAINVKDAKRLIERQDPRVWAVLEKVVQGRLVLLNRAPTLHRLGIQAFSIVLIEGKAIQLHPLVCKGYNADFDGDQVAIHVPLSIEAQIECWMLMLSSKNLLDPANGNPIVTPTQDMLLGLYILTKIQKKAKGEGKAFSSFDEAFMSYEFGYLDLHALIKIPYKGSWRDTTLGRLIFNEQLPKDYPFVDEVIDDKKIRHIISEFIRNSGAGEAVECLDGLKEVGYRYSTSYGVSIGVDDIIIPQEKYKLIQDADAEVAKIEKSFREGILSKQERYNRVLERWNEVNNKIKNIMFDLLLKDRDGFNPVFMMADSGARGSKEQIRQLAGMRGLMAKPSGEIIDVPIKSNFKEGLTMLEYFNSTHGARKGLADTALKTADAGYLTRKLVDVAQNLVIFMEDCGTTEGLEIKAIRQAGDERLIESLHERIVGRYALEDIYHPRTKELILGKNQEISPETALEIERVGIKSVNIRSVVGCMANSGICVRCYGRNLATGKTVEIGEAVGIIAAQSIGQPGTQLTMRTFHVGGVASMGGGAANKISLNYSALVESLPEDFVSRENGDKILTRNGEVVVKPILSSFSDAQLKNLKVKDGENVFPEDVLGKHADGQVVLAQNTATVKIVDKQIFLLGDSHSIDLKIGSVLFVKVGDILEKDQEIAEVEVNSDLIIAEMDGEVYYEDIIMGVTVRTVKESGKKIQRFIQETKEQDLFPQIILKSRDGKTKKSYLLPIDCLLLVEEGKEVRAGDILARVAGSQIRVKDITGGLPKITELFEARVPKHHNYLAKEDGILYFKEKAKGKYVFVLEYEDKEEGKLKRVKYSIPTIHNLYVRDGERVKKGQSLCSGEKNPHDVLRILGVKAVTIFLLDRIQEVYREQGVRIDDKHIGVIIRNMLSKVEITESGDTGLIMNQKIDRFKLAELNHKTVEEGGAPAKFRPVLMGITKTALHTDSFIAAASFQETTRILTQASIKGAEDNLVGLKENIIIGQIVPSGTGFFTKNTI